MKGNIGKIFLAIIIVVVLIISFIYMHDTNKETISKILDVTKDVEIDGK